MTKGLVRFFEVAAKAPEPEDIRFGIPKDVMLYHVRLALRQGILEPYQALLMTVANMNFPARHGVVHPLQLIDLYNDRTRSVAVKTRELLMTAMAGGITYPELDEAGLTSESGKTQRITSLYNLLYPPKDTSVSDPTTGPEQNRSGIRRIETISPYGLFGPDNVQTTYSAIPKENLLKALVDAVEGNRIDFEQVAMIIAVNCHSLEVRRNGQRYLDHIMAVAGNPDLTKSQKVLAILHDVIENSNYRERDFFSVGLPTPLIRSLQAISILPVYDRRHRKIVDKEPYFAFVQRCACDHDALAVKIADISHNICDTSEIRRNKYEISLGYLRAVQRNEVDPKVTKVEQWAGAYMPEQLKIFHINLLVGQTKKDWRIRDTEVSTIASFDPEKSGRGRRSCFDRFFAVLR